jgi:hypothetical protein
MVKVTDSGTMRFMIKRLDSLSPLRQKIVEKVGRFPCCGELEEEFKSDFFDLCRASKILREDLRKHGMREVTIRDGEEFLTIKL